MPHLRQLDGLRAIAVLVVFIGHARLFPAFPGGFGVTIFFFLSGYLITTLLRIERAQTGAVSLRGFYWRRVLRINPPLWLTMLAMAGPALAGWFGSPTALSGRGVAAQALFLSNYLWRNEGLPSVLWSLAVEEHFYLVFPLCFVLAMRRLSASGMALACLVACGAVLGLRVFNIVVLGIVEENYYWSHTRIDSILAGCILALWQNPVVERDTAWKPGRWLVLLALASLAVGMAVRAPLFREGVRYTLQGAALFVLFSAVLQDRGRVSRLLHSWPMQKLGLWSYTFYLVHYAMIFLVTHNLPELGRPLEALLAGGMAVAYAAAMHALVEKPLGRWRQRLNRVEEPDVRLAG